MRVEMSRHLLGLLVAAASTVAVAGDHPSTGWDAMSSVVATELGVMNASEERQAELERRGLWLLGALGKARETSLAPISEVEMYYAANMLSMTPQQVASKLGIDVPPALKDLNTTMRVLRDDQKTPAAIDNCMTQGDESQKAMCQMINLDVLTSHYEPPAAAKAIGYKELLDGNRYLATIIELATSMSEDDGTAVSSLPSRLQDGIAKATRDDSLNIALARRSLVLSALLVESSFTMGNVPLLQAGQSPVNASAAAEAGGAN